MWTGERLSSEWKWATAVDVAELEEVDGALRRYLAEQGLGWIVAQVDDLIREERQVLAEPTSPRYASWPVDELHVSGRPTKPVYTTRPYTLEERVVLLIEATQRALRDALEVELAIAEFLSDPHLTGDEWLQLRFVDETETLPERSFLSEPVEDRRAVAQNVGTLLEQLLDRVRS
jgi:hypothetical protein